ncbi:DUF3939 domain-containing protein [Paenibacillus sp. HB172176]|uniref:DUF3939 domain-containing protein n=1 Tax=Paenibacillus sp. HB172176 TaxID=2493690 RepID=UPI001F0DE943|nr:DUF3939 domain-containing protein [Paenibacillus sp. HB172176]
MEVLPRAVARSWMRAAAGSALLLLFAGLLSGCLYPKDQLRQNGAPKEAVRNVQGAIDQYFGDTGLLPIKNSSEDVPLYEKFKLDFVKLQREGYIGDIPSAAFENGGNYYFLIINEETDPTIKLMDIVVYQQINDLQKAVDAYKKKEGQLPKGEAAYPGFYTIDYKSLPVKEPIIRSEFSGHILPAIIDDNGTVYTDYAVDIMQQLIKLGDAKPPVDDLRALLVDNSDYVPVKAPIYRWNDGDPEAVAS